MDILIDTLSTKDSFLRFKTLAAVEKLRREHPSLDFKKDPIESLALTEVRKYFNRLGLHYNLFVRARHAEGLTGGGRPEREAHPLGRSPLPAARPAVPVEGHRGLTSSDRAWQTRAAARERSSTWTT